MATALTDYSMLNVLEKLSDAQIQIKADEKQKRMIEEAFKNLKKGVPLTIVSNNLISAIENGGPGLESFDLTETPDEPETPAEASEEEKEVEEDGNSTD